ncbi:MAG: type IV toxin-antitoxin system AbiEi family antitoxin [Chloroflexota bacterium]|nr:type IV toxin-antitoxin system AbiEi family antitoxin [Chloroflexota bacterium]
MKSDWLLKSKNAIEECLQGIPFLNFRELRRVEQIGSYMPDLIYTIEGEGTKNQLVVEVKTLGEPRFAREAATQLNEYLDALPGAYGIFVSNYISPAAARICREKGIGFIDIAGNCFIQFDNVYIKKEGNPNPSPRKGYLRSLYSPKSERILRVLLDSDLREWKTEQLAQEADVSIGLVSKVKKLLEDKEWLASKTIGFSLVDPLSLLEDWVRNYKFQRNEIKNYYSLLSLSEIETQISQRLTGEKYCFTAFSAAARYSNVVRYRRAMVYVDTDFSRLEYELGLKRVGSGFNLSIIKPYDSGVFYGTEIKEGAAIGSPIQVYLDLMNVGSRGEEAASALFKEAIEVKW